MLRAGTTGIMCLMHYEGLDCRTAIAEAKKRRCIIFLLQNSYFKSIDDWGGHYIRHNYKV